MTSNPSFPNPTLYWQWWTREKKRSNLFPLGWPTSGDTVPYPGGARKSTQPCHGSPVLNAKAVADLITWSARHSYSSQASCLAPGFLHLPTTQKHDPNLNLSPTWLEDMRARVVAKARDWGRAETAKSVSEHSNTSLSEGYHGHHFLFQSLNGCDTEWNYSSVQNLRSVHHDEVFSPTGKIWAA